MVVPYDPKNLKGSFTPNLNINKQGIQRGLNFVFPKANFDFAGGDAEEINQDDEFIEPILSKKTGGIDWIILETESNIGLVPFLITSSYYFLIN